MALGYLNWLLRSTMWSHWCYLWERDILSNCNEQKVLEIDPGYGLISAVLLKEFPNARIDWILFGKQNSSLLEQKNEGYVRGLNKIKEKYSGQIKEIWGQIEREQFCIEEGDYDLIIMTEVFEHFVLNPIVTLIKLREALAEDGSIVFTTPNWGHVHIYEQWQDLPSEENVDDERYQLLTKCGHTYQYNKGELDEIFMRSGLKIMEYKISDSNNHNYILKRDKLLLKNRDIEIVIKGYQFNWDTR